MRLSPHSGGAELRVVSPEVVPLDAGGRTYRMYYEGTAKAGDEARNDSGIRSAISNDGGLVFTPEPGWRLRPSGSSSVNSPRVLPLRDGSHRMYASFNGPSGAGIVSALSTDGGLTFVMEDGVRIPKETAYELHSVFAPEVLCVGACAVYSLAALKYLRERNVDYLDGAFSRSESLVSTEFQQNVWLRTGDGSMSVATLPYPRAETRAATVSESESLLRLLASPDLTFSSTRAVSRRLHAGLNVLSTGVLSVQVSNVLRCNPKPGQRIHHVRFFN